MTMLEGRYLIKKLLHYSEENVSKEKAAVSEEEVLYFVGSTMPKVGVQFYCSLETGNSLITSPITSVFEKDTDNDKLIVPPEFVNLVVDMDYDIIFATKNSVYGILSSNKPV